MTAHRWPAPGRKAGDAGTRSDEPERAQAHPHLARCLRLCLGIVAALLAWTSAPAHAALPLSVGPYKAQVWTDPATIALGKARIYVALKDSTGKPVSGAQMTVLAKMPTMDMGEKEMPAQPDSAEPGVYAAPANFAMEGAFQITLKVTAPQAATGKLDVNTGQNTGGAPGAAGEGTGGGGLLGLLPWALLAAAVAFVLYRVRKTGQRLRLQSLLNRQAVVGLGTLALMLVVSNWAVNSLRRPGSMTPLEAQGMEMETPAPPGTAAVALASVTRGSISSSVHYTGQAVGYVEQDVYPKVSGWITWMPFYAGDRVKKGQLLARLSSPDLGSKVNEQRANALMAQEAASVSRLEYQQGLAAAAQARSEINSKRGSLEEARRMRTRAEGLLRESQAGVTEAENELAAAQATQRAAESEQAEARAMLQSVRAQEPQAEAEIAAAMADQAYWVKELARMKVLYQKGAVSGEEYQREEAQSKTADAKVQQAQARLQAVKTDIQAAQARVAMAGSRISSAQAQVARDEAGVQAALAKMDQTRAEIAAATGRVQMAQGELEAAQNRARAMEAAAGAGASRVHQAQAGLQQAEAALTTATVVNGYLELRSLADGVVTQRVVSPGVLVSPGQTILKVAQVSPIRLQANVAQEDLKQIRLGATVVARGEGSHAKPVTVSVTSITPAVDPSTRTGVVEALYDNRDGRFKPGDYVAMDISTGHDDEALRVPSSAIQTRTLASGDILDTTTTPYVWVAEPQAGQEGLYTVKPLRVKVGRSDGTTTEILSGLAEGQRVVTEGYENLNEGDTVSVAGTEPAQPAAPPAEGSGGMTMPGM